MADFLSEDLRGSRFERVDLSGSRFWASELNGAQFRGVELHGVVMRGVELADVDIDGELANVTVNGVDIGPLVEAELDRRHPDRAKMRPTDPAGFREAWDVIERLWAGTVERARRLRPALLHESVDGEWSFIETLRHLAFATDCLDQAGDPRRPGARGTRSTCRGTRCPTPRACPRDREARPSLDEVLDAPRATGWPPCARWSTA